MQAQQRQLHHRLMVLMLPNFASNSISCVSVSPGSLAGGIEEAFLLGEQSERLNIHRFHATCEECRADLKQMCSPCNNPIPHVPAGIEGTVTLELGICPGFIHRQEMADLTRGLPRASHERTRPYLIFRQPGQLHFVNPVNVPCLAKRLASFEHTACT